MLLVLLACANPDYIRLYYAADKAPSLSWEAIGNPAEAPRAGGRRASMRRRRHALLRCARCGGQRSIVGIVRSGCVARTILDHLGEGIVVPRLAPARGPPE